MHQTEPPWSKVVVVCRQTADIRPKRITAPASMAHTTQRKPKVAGSSVSSAMSLLRGDDTYEKMDQSQGDTEEEENDDDDDMCERHRWSPAHRKQTFHLLQFAKKRPITSWIDLFDPRFTGYFHNPGQTHHGSSSTATATESFLGYFPEIAEDVFQDNSMHREPVMVPDKPNKTLLRDFKVKGANASLIASYLLADDIRESEVEEEKDDWGDTEGDIPNKTGTQSGDCDDEYDLSKHQSQPFGRWVMTFGQGELSSRVERTRETSGRKWVEIVDSATFALQDRHVFHQRIKGLPTPQHLQGTTDVSETHNSASENIQIVHLEPDEIKGNDQTPGSHPEIDQGCDLIQREKTNESPLCKQRPDETPEYSENGPRITVFERSPSETYESWSKRCSGPGGLDFIRHFKAQYPSIQLYVLCKGSCILPGDYVRLIPRNNDTFYSWHGRRTGENVERATMHWVDPKSKKTSSVHLYLGSYWRSTSVVIQTPEESLIKECLRVPKELQTVKGLISLIEQHLRMRVFVRDQQQPPQQHEQGEELEFFHRLHPKREPIESFWYRHHQSVDADVEAISASSGHDSNTTIRNYLLQTDLEESRKKMDQSVSRFYAEFRDRITDEHRGLLVEEALPDTWEEDFLPVSDAHPAASYRDRREGFVTNGGVPSLATLCNDVISEHLLSYDPFEFRRWVPSYIKPVLFRHLVQRGMLSTRHLIRLLEPRHSRVDFSRVGRALSDFHLAAVAVVNASSLHTLDLSFCRTITDHGLGLLLKQTRQLKHLHLTGCTALTDTSVSNISSECPYLVRLSARGLPLIRGFSCIVKRCPDLAYLYAPWCESMFVSEILLTMTFGGTKMRYLNLKRCGEKAPAGSQMDPSLSKTPIRVPPYIETLKLAHCPGLQPWMLAALFSSSDFPCLHTLDIEGCLTEKFPTVKQAPRLTKLRLPQEFPGRFQDEFIEIKVGTQVVRGLSRRYIPDTMPVHLSEFSQLRTLRLRHSPGHEWYPSSLIPTLNRLAQLEYLELRHVKGLESFPILDQIRKMPNLRKVCLQGIPHQGSDQNPVALVHWGLEELTLNQVALDEFGASFYIEGTYPHLTSFTLVNRPPNMMRIPAMVLLRMIRMMPRLVYLCLTDFPTLETGDFQKEIVSHLTVLKEFTLNDELVYQRSNTVPITASTSS